MAQISSNTRSKCANQAPVCSNSLSTVFLRVFNYVQLALPSSLTMFSPTRSTSLHFHRLPVLQSSVLKPSLANRGDIQLPGSLLVFGFKNRTTSTIPNVRSNVPTHHRCQRCACQSTRDCAGISQREGILLLQSCHYHRRRPPNDTFPLSKWPPG